jgi:hypothetical protein
VNSSLEVLYIQEVVLIALTIVMDGDIVVAITISRDGILIAVEKRKIGRTYVKCIVLLFRSGKADLV